MRVLSISAQKPHSTGSGVYLTETVREMCDAGHSCAVLSGVEREDTVSFPEGVGFYPVYYSSPALPFPVCGMSDEMPYVSTRYRDMTAAMVSQFEEEFSRVLKMAVTEFRPDIIVCHHLYLLCALARSLLPDIPVYGVCHGSDLRQLRTNPLCLEKILTAVSRLDKICCLHEAQRREIVDLFGISQERCAVVGTGYNSRIFFDRRTRRPHDRLRLMYAGKISGKKGVYSLISALSHLGLRQYEFSLRLAGGWSLDSQRDRTLELIRLGGWDAVLLGPVSQDVLAQEFSDADIFVLPSFSEGLPLVIPEALACGARVVCTDLPGIRDWLDNTVPGNAVRYAAPPDMKNSDEPMPEDLTRFECDLARAILNAASDPAPCPDLRGVSWAAAAERIL